LFGMKKVLVRASANFVDHVGFQIHKNSTRHISVNFSTRIIWIKPDNEQKELDRKKERERENRKRAGKTRYTQGKANWKGREREEEKQLFWRGKGWS
jgi:hypothetical protein